MAQFKVGDLPELLQDFERLKAASENAPTVTRMIVNGQAYITLDGTPYRHYLRDFSDELSARWCPLAPEAENQQGQLRLVEAYMALLEML